MGINGIGNPFSQSSVYGRGEVESSKTLVRENAEGDQYGNMVVTEARARVSFAVATPQLADAMNLTPDERLEFIRSFEEKAASASVNLGHKSVMLDIYAVMELIREMGQKLRNAMREMRQCQNQAIQQNLKSQAEMQRHTAVVQMFASLAVMVVQTGLSLKGTMDQLESLKAQTKFGNKLGADVAQKQLKMAETGGRQDLALKQLNNVKKNAPAGFKNDGPMLKTRIGDQIPADVKSAQGNVSTKQEALVQLEGQKAELEQKLASGKLNKVEARTCEYDIKAIDAKIDVAKGELVDAVKDYNKLVGIDPEQAQGQVDKYQETIHTDQKELAEALKNQNDLEGRHLQEQKDLADLAASEGVFFDEDSRTELDTRQAEELSKAEQLVSKAREKVGKGSCIANIEETPNGRALLQEKYHEAMLSEVEGYKKKYDLALGQSNSEKRINGKVSDTTKAALEDATYRYNLARAEQVYQSSSLDTLPPDAHQKVANNLTNELVGINERVNVDLKASGVEQKAARGMFLQGAANALGGFLQKAVDCWGQVQQSHTTETQADEKMLEEQLDQLKELFNQVLSLIQKATELFQSVVSKESQSLEEIINALKA